MDRRILCNTDIVEIEISVPENHRHLRTTLRLAGGEELVLQEATVAALVRGFVAIKTHPTMQQVKLVGSELQEGQRKKGFAAWQLLETK